MAGRPPATDLMIKRLTPLSRARDEILAVKGPMLCKAGCTFWDEIPEKSFQCRSSEMCVFGVIGKGENSVVRKAIHIPTHRVMAIKDIYVYETARRQQIFEDVARLCQSPKYEGLVDYYGVYYPLDRGGITIAMEYVNGGSLADILRKQRFIHEPDLSIVATRMLEGLISLHRLRHEMHLNLKPSNWLFNLNGQAKLTDYGLTEGLLDKTTTMCATSDVRVTYMSPERISNESYSFPADVWSFGLIMLECATGNFPYNATQGMGNLMLQMRCDPHPMPPRYPFSWEFRAFIECCLRKDPECRRTASHLPLTPFIWRFESEEKYIDLPGTIQGHFSPTQRLKELAEMLVVHYYMLFDGTDKLWPHMKSFYRDISSFSFAGQVAIGTEQVFKALSEVRQFLAGEWHGGKIVHVVEDVQWCAYGQTGIMVRASGVMVVGSHFIPLGEGIQVEGTAAVPSLDSQRRQLATFSEKFVMQPAELSDSFYISKQDLEVEPSPHCTSLLQHHHHDASCGGL